MLRVHVEMPRLKVVAQIEKNVRPVTQKLTHYSKKYRLFPIQSVSEQIVLIYKPKPIVGTIVLSL